MHDAINTTDTHLALSYTSSQTPPNRDCSRVVESAHAKHSNSNSRADVNSYYNNVNKLDDKTRFVIFFVITATEP